MKRGWALIMSLVVISLWFTKTGIAGEPHAKSLALAPRVIYAFGDSYSDGGEQATFSAFTVSRTLMSAAPPRQQAQWQPAKPGSYYMPAGGGRWTDGPTAVEVLASRLGASLKNYAVGGAKSGRDNYSPWLDHLTPTGVLSQIDRFKQENEDGRSARGNAALYFIFVSANDYFQAQDNLAGAGDKEANSDRIAKLAEKAVGNIKSATEALADSGAQRFLVGGSSDLALVPWEAFYGRQKDAEEYTLRVNQGLATLTETLKAEQSLNITLFDHKAATDRIRMNPGNYGLEILYTPCVLTTYPDPAKAAASKPCVNPATHYFWDEWHPSATIHRLVGEAMYQTVLTP